MSDDQIFDLILDILNLTISYCTALQKLDDMLCHISCTKTFKIRTQSLVTMDCSFLSFFVCVEDLWVLCSFLCLYFMIFELHIAEMEEVP